MPTDRLTQTIDRPLVDVFAVVSAPGSYADWNPAISASRPLDDGAASVGARFEWTLAGFGEHIVQVAEYEENSRILLAPQSSMFGGGHLFVLTERDAGTRIDHTLHMNPRGIWKLMTPIMGMMDRRNLKKTTNALKAHLELG